ncbi:MAG TPA: hypothetical protein VMI06_19875 [Terriglobia bacterium]|nr:hypothetical protein [Terriglobia bacterium]
MSKRRSNAKNPPVVSPDEILSEEELDEIEADPELHRMMRESEEDIRAGRVYTREEVDELLSERVHRR